MWWRVLILLNISFYNMMGNVFAAGISSLFGLLIAEFHCTSDEAARLATYALLMLGLSVSSFQVHVYQSFNADNFLESHGPPSSGVFGQEIHNHTLYDRFSGLQHMGCESSVLQLLAWQSVPGRIFWGYRRSTGSFHRV